MKTTNYLHSVPLVFGLGAAALGTTRDSQNEVRTRRFLMREVNQRVNDIHSGTCRPNAKDNGNRSVITCEGRAAKASFSATPAETGGVNYEYVYGLLDGKDEQKSSVHVAVGADGKCVEASAENVMTGLSADARDTISTADRSPEDAGELCRTLTVLVEGIQRAVDKKVTEQLALN